MPYVLTQDEVQRREQWRRACIVCGVMFGWSKNGDRAICCSRKCSGSFNGKNKNRPIIKLAKYTCAKCNKDFLSYHKNRKFCSIDCTRKDREIGGPVPRWASRVDANHKEIVCALEKEGASVLDASSIGYGFPDLLIGYCGVTILMEIKNPKTQYGRSGLNKRQKEWHEKWLGGPLVIVYDVQGALNAVRTAR